ncbi:MAG: metallophosphoesterase [Balneolaceae bacterium]
MRRIIHISDLHFGRENKEIEQELLKDIHKHNPSVVVVSGDLTQRAKLGEFQAAKKFLAQIPFPKIIVPGNHDIPLYNLYGRFIKRLSRFRKHISKNIDKNFEDEEIAVFGINSARSFTFKKGRISMSQIKELKESLAMVGEEKLKILVTHHPLPSLGRFGLALPVLEEGGMDVLLTGHIHESSVGNLKTNLTLTNNKMLAISAGTAISARTRGEPNSYNLIEVKNQNLELKLCAWSPEESSFHQAGFFEFHKNGDKWEQVKSE